MEHEYHKCAGCNVKIDILHDAFEYINHDYFCPKCVEDDEEKGAVAMQVRCIYCKREQYAMAVFPISHGEHPCVWCGKTPPVFKTEEEYYKALKKKT